MSWDRGRQRLIDLEKDILMSIVVEGFLTNRMGDFGGKTTAVSR